MVSMVISPEVRSLAVVAALCGLAHFNPTVAALSALVAAFITVRRELVAPRRPKNPPRLPPGDDDPPRLPPSR